MAAAIAPQRARGGAQTYESALPQQELSVE